MRKVREAITMDCLISAQVSYRITQPLRMGVFEILSIAVRVNLSEVPRGIRRGLMESLQPPNGGRT